MNQPDRALADLNHALELAPQKADLLLDIATIYRQRGQSARCLTTIHHLTDTYSPGEEPQSALMLEGLVLMDLNRPKQASEALALAAQRGQPNVEVLYHLARAYTAAGDSEQAAATAQQALAVDASHEPTRQLISRIATRPEGEDVQRR
jgi:cytochrome c-type biogenesis protein CcmH/NrfG